MGFRNGLTRLFAGLALLLGSMLTTPALAAGLMTPTNSGLPPLQIREQHVTVGRGRRLRHHRGGAGFPQSQ